MAVNFGTDDIVDRQIARKRVHQMNSELKKRISRSLPLLAVDSRKRLILAVYIGCFLLCLVSAFILWITTRDSFLEPFRALRETLITGLGTRSSLVAMPAAMQGLHEGFDLDQEQVNLIISHGVTLCRCAGD